MTGKQCRDKTAHAIRDIIKQNKSSKNKIRFSKSFGGLFNQVSDNRDSDDEERLAVSIFGTYDNNVDEDALLTWEETSRSSSEINTRQNEITNSLHSNELESDSVPHISILENAMADCHYEFSTDAESDWFLKVIEWTLGSNGTYGMEDEVYG